MRISTNILHLIEEPRKRKCEGLTCGRPLLTWLLASFIISPIALKHLVFSRIGCGPLPSLIVSARRAMMPSTWVSKNGPITSVLRDVPRPETDLPWVISARKWRAWWAFNRLDLSRSQIHRSVCLPWASLFHRSHLQPSTIQTLLIVAPISAIRHNPRCWTPEKQHWVKTWLDFPHR